MGRFLGYITLGYLPFTLELIVLLLLLLLVVKVGSLVGVSNGFLINFGQWEENTSNIASGSGYDIYWNHPLAYTSFCAVAGGFCDGGAFTNATRTVDLASSHFFFCNKNKSKADPFNFVCCFALGA